MFCEVEEEVDIIDGGIDLEIIVIGLFFEGNVNVEGRGFGEGFFGDWFCCFFSVFVVVLRGVRGLILRFGGFSLIEFVFGILERFMNKKVSSFNEIYM